jgi:hypothetical protein
VTDPLVKWLSRPHILTYSLNFLSYLHCLESDVAQDPLPHRLAIILIQERILLLIQWPSFTLQTRHHGILEACSEPQLEPDISNDKHGKAEHCLEEIACRWRAFTWNNGYIEGTDECEQCGDEEKNGHHRPETILECIRHLERTIALRF